jgi:DNA-binding beta-propeller fold protein YncE
MRRRRPSVLVLGLVATLALVLAATAAAKPSKPPKAGGGTEHVQPPVETSAGSLEQLPGRLGCLAQGRASVKLCGRARALKGAGPFMGSRAIAISPDGRNVYVAAGGSDAIAVFVRDRRTGALTQSKGKAGCAAAKAAEGCALAPGLIGPNSVAVSPDGRNVYATARGGGAVVTFHRNRATGALRELPPAAAGCISGASLPFCAAGRALKAPDVVVVSPDGRNVYVGDFFGNGVASFSRAAGSGALTQLSGTAGCIVEGGGEGCAAGAQLGAVEGLAVSGSGTAVYAAAAVADAVTILARDPSTGALTQRGCITDVQAAGCGLGYEIAGANALAVAPQGGDVYATSLLSNSLTTFRPTEGAGGPGIGQPPGPERQVSKEKGPGKETVPAAPGTPSPDGCTVFLRSPGCGFGRAMQAPEGVDVSPDGTSVYVAAFGTGAIDAFDRDPESGVVTQKSGTRGCVAPVKVPGCTPGRALGGAGSLVVSPDGRNVYSTSRFNHAVDVFRRIR